MRTKNGQIIKIETIDYAPSSSEAMSYPEIHLAVAIFWQAVVDASHGSMEAARWLLDGWCPGCIETKMGNWHFIDLDWNKFYDWLEDVLYKIHNNKPIEKINWRRPKALKTPIFMQNDKLVEMRKCFKPPKPDDRSNILFNQSIRVWNVLG